MRILVCGSRHFDDYNLMRATFLKEMSEGDTLIHGCARGADLLAEEVWNNFPGEGFTERYPANWATYSKGAGPIRNKQMLDEGKPDMVIAFLAPNSRGTKNMIEQAEKAGVPVKVINI